MPELITTIFEKALKSKEFSTILIGILTLINLANLLFPLNLLSELHMINNFTYILDFAYFLMYCSITSLMFFGFCIFYTLIIHFISSNMIERLKAYRNKFLNRIDSYSYTTIQQSTNSYVSSLEWLIVSFLFLLLFDKENLLQKLSTLYKYFDNGKFLPIVLICLFSLLTVISLFIIISKLYKRYLIQEDFYFNSDKYN